MMFWLGLVNLNRMFCIVLVVGNSSNLQAKKEEKETESGCGCARRPGQESSYAIPCSLSRPPGIACHLMLLSWTFMVH